MGKAFDWCILILTLSTCSEVFVRYVLNSPTVWAFDMSVQMYGALFMMAGAYTLSQDGHVPADVAVSQTVEHVQDVGGRRRCACLLSCHRIRQAVTLGRPATAARLFEQVVRQRRRA